MRLIMSVLFLCLCFRSSSAMLISQSNQVPEQSPSALTNKDILDMVGAGLTAEVLVAKIKSSKCDFNTSPDELKALKMARVPDSVILAMVEAPRVHEVESTQDAVLRTAKITCLNVKSIPVLRAPGVLPPVAQVDCGERISVLEEKSLWDKVRTPSGTVGYIADLFVTKDAGNRPGTSQQETPRSGSLLLSNTLRALAWRGVPWVTTTYYQQPGSASTDCMGSGTWLGNFWQGNASCTTQYTPAQNIPLNWQHFTIFNLVETSDSWMVLGCTRNWAFSKCSYLVPGSIFSFENKGGKISIRGHRAGKDKEQSLDLDIISSTGKTNP